MEARRRTCNWCGVSFPGPSLYCPACHRYTSSPSDFEGYYQHGGRRNDYHGYLPYGVSSNNYATGYTANGWVYQPNNAARVYQVPSWSYTNRTTASGPKRAVLCGITYKGHRQSLDGSINDVLSMKKLLMEKFGFPSASIVVLTEEQDYRHIPTKKNIRTALNWLVQGCKPGDSLVFHYSGHGSQVRDHDGDELDGYDESLLPVDYETEGRILDDEINATIVRPLPRGATLHSIIDTCFSGTFLDLPNVCRINRDGYYKWEDQRVAHSAFKGTSGGYAICISACDDHQNSGDTTAFTGKATGALTHSFVQAVEQQPRLTYGHLLLALYRRISAAREELGLRNNYPHLSQEPQLSSSHKFDIHSKAFTL
ncbi:metacaspase-3-like [Andrographis paniculata]|uniref:metacaspase-3-like n=1 Tax=Andrographis paniculata TaxID=175694 RepID=UPI0021E7FAB4|nr:metacaspase-3-like [Andrographis paniculata]